MPQLLPKELPRKRLTQFSIGSYWLRQGEVRLDGSPYAQRAFLARKTIKEAGFPIVELSQLAAEVFMLPLKVNIPFTPSAQRGAPYLTQSELFHFRPQPRKFVYTDRLAEPDRWKLKEGWVILTQSGTVGVPLFVPKRLEAFIASPNPIRIIAKQEAYSGYIFAYLASWIGHALVSQDIYGGTVDHLLPHHVEHLQVPLLPQRLQRQIHERVVEAASLRDEANRLLDRAEDLFHQSLGLSPFDPEEVTYYGESPVKAFSINARDLNLRLDASYHIPLAAAAVDKLKATGCPLATVNDLAERVFIPPRFKRIYVEEEYGVPFLQGTHIVQIKPYDIKYLSSLAHKDLEKWIIRHGWVLVTCSGTVGRIALTPKQWDGWAATQHILRIVPDPPKSHPGYIAVFLATPYGSYQVTSQVYGAVVDELTEDQMKEVLIPNLPLDLQTKIGSLATDAYEMKERANNLEEEAVTLLESSLRAQPSP